jgi:hypothetical protein
LLPQQTGGGANIPAVRAFAILRSTRTSRNQIPLPIDASSAAAVFGCAASIEPRMV